MPAPVSSRKALLGGALLLLGLLWASLGTAKPPAEGVCRPEGIDHWAEVRSVVDGDTLVLADGRRLRLIGIDTPELAREGRPPRALANQARRALQELAPRGTRLALRFDAHRHDRYERLLAHLYTANGSSIQEALLARGLAVQTVVPPNLDNLSCYANAEREARSAGRGLWSLPGYQVHDAGALGPKTRGFRRVSGTVRRVGRGGGAVWLDLTADFAIRIPESDLRYFKGIRLSELVGRRVEARGWVYRRRGQLRLEVRHPAALGTAPALSRAEPPAARAR